jgi:hypothetical protein
MNRTTHRKEAIRAATGHLGIGSIEVNKLTDVTRKLSDKAFVVMLELLSQPDPHGTICEDIRKRYWSTADNHEGFSNWLRNAHLCYHTVNGIVSSVLPDHDDTTTRIINGLHHYRDENPAYTDEQITDFARVTAAAFVTVIDNYAMRNIRNEYGSITTTDFHNDRFCTHLHNETIMGLAAGSHAKADEIVSIILRSRVCSETEIMHVLEGGSPSMAHGLL